MPQGANIPCSPEARSRCARLGVLVIPDFIANAGGVIGASIELRGGTERAAFDYIDERIRSNTRWFSRKAGARVRSRGLPQWRWRRNASRGCRDQTLGAVHFTAALKQPHALDRIVELSQ